MNLYKYMLNNGSYLFKYRGQIPLILFLVSIPIIHETSYLAKINQNTQLIIQYTAIFIGIFGLFLRYFTTATTPNGTSGRNRDKQIADRLNTTGIYSVVRNPLYLANYLIWLGISIYSASYILVIVSSFIFFIVYERIILTEELYLSRKYKEKYSQFLLKTPCFLPSIKKYRKSNESFSFKKILKQEYSSTLSTIIAFIYIDVLTNYTFNNILNFEKVHIIILGVSVFLTLLLKIIRTYSKYLD